jgi:thymidylate kinase
MAALKPIRRRGKFVVIYGPNNIGKSWQIKMLASRLIRSAHQSFMVIKYPLYEFEPTGPKINAVLRFGKKMAPWDFQKLQFQNKLDFQDTIINLLNSGVDVIAEDYLGTGIAWGMIENLGIKELEDINYGLIKPDVSILLDGKRRIKAREVGHRFEDGSEQRWLEVRDNFRRLALKYKWKIISYNTGSEVVHEKIWSLVSNLILEAKLVRKPK